VLGPASSAGGAIRDDSAWLQAKLDAGGAVFLPRLPDGKCYATRGLWVSRDDTTVTSDGACIVALGPGEGRIPRGDGTFVTANAVFFVDHSDLRKPLPVRIAISGLHITVPASRRMHGISVLGHEVTLTSLTIDGSPLTDVRIGGGTKGSGGMSGRIAVTDSTLSGGLRDVVSVFGPVGLRVEGNVLSGARGKTAAGLHIRAADRGQPTLDVHVTGNKVAANSGPGIFLDLAPANGLPVLASGIEIARNEIIGNAREAPKVRRGGVVLAGGQSDGKGQIVVRENVFRGNRGPDLLRRKGPPANIKAGPRSVPPPSTAPVRDDTAWLQARLDRAGGTIFLPKLPNGECYATRGLWVSRDGTTITSDGACIVSLGLGPVRLHSIDGDPIAASAVFFVNRSTPSKPAPVRISISNLRIVVPEGQSMYGVAVFGHQVTLSHLDIGGSPKDDVTISGRGNGNSYAGSISIIDSTLSGRKPQRSLGHSRHRAAHRTKHDRRGARFSARSARGRDRRRAGRPRPARARRENRREHDSGQRGARNPARARAERRAGGGRDGTRDQRQHDLAELCEANAAETRRDCPRRRTGRRPGDAGPPGQRDPGKRWPGDPREPAQAAGGLGRERRQRQRDGVTGSRALLRYAASPESGRARSANRHEAAIRFSNGEVGRPPGRSEGCFCGHEFSFCSSLPSQ